jgi:hypothetical protein
MIDGRGQAALAEEPIAGFGRLQRMSQHFQRDPSTAFQIIGFEHRAHAAPAQLSDQPVVAELLTRLG